MNCFFVTFSIKKYNLMSSPPQYFSSGFCTDSIFLGYNKKVTLMLFMSSKIHEFYSNLT